MGKVDNKLKMNASLIVLFFLLSGPIFAQTWITVGDAGFSEGMAFETSIAIDKNGTPYVVYQDSKNGDKATVIKYSDTLGKPQEQLVFL